MHVSHHFPNLRVARDPAKCQGGQPRCGGRWRLVVFGQLPGGSSPKAIRAREVLAFDGIVLAGPVVCLDISSRLDTRALPVVTLDRRRYFCRGTCGLLSIPPHAFTCFVKGSEPFPVGRAGPLCGSPAAVRVAAPMVPTSLRGVPPPPISGEIFRVHQAFAPRHDQ